MFLVVSDWYSYQAPELPLDSISWLRWYRDEPAVKIYRLQQGKFELLKVIDKPISAEGKVTLPEPQWTAVDVLGPTQPRRRR